MADPIIQGGFRPTQYVLLSEEIRLSLLEQPYSQSSNVCPGAIFEVLHPRHSSIESVINVSTTSSVHHNNPDAQVSVDSFKELDTYGNILSIVAHDTGFDGVMEYHQKLANQWRKKGRKGQCHWRFLRDFDTGDIRYESERL